METTATMAAPSKDDLIAAAMEAVDKPQSAAPPPPQREPVSQPPPPYTNSEAPMVTSPTLEALEKLRRPRPATVCEGCPNSVWFTSPTEVKCYCRVMYLVTWSTKEPNQITACDGIFVGQKD